jgi:hypothetical protein
MLKHNLRGLLAVQHHHPHIADIGVRGAGFEGAAEGLEEVIGIATAEEIGGVEFQGAHAGDEFGVENRTGSVDGSIP